MQEQFTPNAPVRILKKNPNYWNAGQPKADCLAERRQRLVPRPQFRQHRPESVLVVGDAGSRGDWGTVLAYAGYVTIFIGIVNLIPLPPLDGGHLMLLAWEKLTGRQVDYRRLVPVSAAVIVLLSLFVVATVFLDLTKPLPLT